MSKFKTVKVGFNDMVKTLNGAIAALVLLSMVSAIVGLSIGVGVVVYRLVQSAL